MEIPLTQGKMAMVDDEMFKELNRYKWHAHKHGRTFYAAKWDGAKHRKLTFLHTMVLGDPLEGCVIDHVDGDGLNNTTGNLRFITQRQNRQNLHIEKSSRFPGVHYHKPTPASAESRSAAEANRLEAIVRRYCMKTQYCDECEHRKWVDDGNGLACKIGHKPRFFKPTGNPYFENWGWKRKCADFVVGKHVQMLTPSNAEVSRRRVAPIGFSDWLVFVYLL